MRTEIQSGVYKALYSTGSITVLKVYGLYKAYYYYWLSEAYRALPVRVGALLGHCRSEFTALRHIEPAT